MSIFIRTTAPSTSFYCHIISPLPASLNAGDMIFRQPYGRRLKTNAKRVLQYSLCNCICITYHELPKTDTVHYKYFYINFYEIIVFISKIL